MNALPKLPFKAVYSFWPGFMKPGKGQQNVRLIYCVLANVAILFTQLDLYGAGSRSGCDLLRIQRLWQSHFRDAGYKMTGEVMKVTEIKSCIVGPALSPEQFVAEHFFVFLAKGVMNGFDGTKHYILKAGESCLVRKNRLARYNKVKEENEFEKVIIFFDELFLKDFQKKHSIPFQKHPSKDAFIQLKKDKLIHSFLVSLEPYYTGSGAISTRFTDLKREELLLILLALHPDLSGVLFDYGIPGRLDLEAFMQQNYKFNVTMERFAFLTGRSLSAFKRDFKTIFDETPNRWLVKRRLQEARFLIEAKGQKPTEIYQDLGFEDLSHFSFAFKKEFGLTATALSE